MVIVSLNGKFYITILNFKKGGLVDSHGIGQVFFGSSH